MAEPRQHQVNAYIRPIRALGREVAIRSMHMSLPIAERHAREPLDGDRVISVELPQPRRGTFRGRLSVPAS